MFVHQPVERGSIDTGQPGGLRHVSAGPRHQSHEVVPLELGNHLVFGGVVGLVRNVNRRGPLGSNLSFIVHRNVVRAELLVRLSQHRDVLDHVLEFPHVPGPGPGPQVRDTVLGQLGGPPRHPAVPAPVMSEEMIREEGDILKPFPERWEGDGNDPKTVVEVPSQNAAFHRLLRFPIGGRDEPDIDHRILDLGTDSADHPILHHPQQLSLEGQGHFGEFVEEQRPAARRLEQPELVPVRPGKRALAMPEHLRLEEGLGQRGAVNRHQGLLGAPAVLVNEVGNDLFAGAAFAADENRGVRRRHLPSQFDRLAEQGGNPDHHAGVAVALLLHELLA